MLNRWNFLKPGFYEGINLEVGLLASTLYLKDDFGVRVGHLKAGFSVSAPQESVAEVVAVEIKTGVKVRHVEPYAIDLTHKRSGAILPVHEPLHTPGLGGSSSSVAHTLSI